MTTGKIIEQQIDIRLYIKPTETKYIRLLTNKKGAVNTTTREIIKLHIYNATEMSENIFVSPTRKINIVCNIQQSKNY